MRLGDYISNPVCHFTRLYSGQLGKPSWVMRNEQLVTFYFNHHNVLPFCLSLARKVKDVCCRGQRREGAGES